MIEKEKGKEVKGGREVCDEGLGCGIYLKKRVKERGLGEKEIENLGRRMLWFFDFCWKVI